MSETEANQPTAVGGDHLLIVVWIAGEDGGSSTVESLHEGFSDADLTIELLKNSGFLEDGDAGSVSLTDEGRILTESLVRRHRLAEVLLEEVIGVPPSAAASQACDVACGLTLHSTGVPAAPGCSAAQACAVARCSASQACDVACGSTQHVEWSGKRL